MVRPRDAGRNWTFCHWYIRNTSGSLHTLSSNDSLYNNTFACTIDAMWVPSDAWIDPTIDDLVHETITDPLAEQYRFQETHENIVLALDWLNLLNVAFSNQGDTLFTFQAIALTCLNGDYDLMEVCLEAVTALYVADGLALASFGSGRIT
jgi:hypothetical protein